MKVLCSYSSLEFSCEHFPGVLHSREACHPIFQVPQKRLLGFLGKWAASELTPIDSYLLYLSILKSTDLVEFRVPAIRTELTSQIIAQTMEKLSILVSRINSVPNPEEVFPLFIISPETKDLSNVSTWLDIWESSFQEFKSGKFRDYDNRKLAQREFALSRLIRSQHRPIKSYAKQIADWAAVAGDFPTFNITSPISSLPVSLSDYWKTIIIRCAKEESIYLLNGKDLQELLEHCETNIPIGSLHSHALFECLRKANSKLINFLGIDSHSVLSKSPVNSFTILSQETSHEAANMRALIDSAPEEEPKEINYKTKFEYLKAKLRWEMAKKYGPQQ